MEIDDVDHRLGKIREGIGQHIQNQQQVRKLQRNTKWQYLTIAASVALVFSVGIYFYNGSNLKSTPQLLMTNDIGPGRTAATLTLANGKNVILSDQKEGQLATEAGITISKTADGELIYKVTGKGIAQPDQLNTLSTSRGEVFTLILPDGSKIWLNAASSIRYPLAFTTSKQRRVVLRGEAYFEVAKDKQRPFIVQTDDQQTEVLGTHFNMNSYKEEQVTTTTLLEGSLLVAHLNGRKADGKILKPGEAAVLMPGTDIKVMPANIKDAMAWKSGFFRFNQLRIDQVMKQLERWYAIDVVFQGEISEEKFNGAVAFNKNISEVLTMLSYSKAVKFKIEGRRVTVMN